MSARKKGPRLRPKPEKVVPRFKSEEKEREFWSSQSSDYIDWSKAKSVTLPRLKPSTVTISLRLPESLLDAWKVLANQRDVPYQSLLKIFLAERIEYERRRKVG